MSKTDNITDISQSVSLRASKEAYLIYNNGYLVPKSTKNISKPEICNESF